MELSDLIFAVCGVEERDEFVKASAIVNAHKLKLKLLDAYTRYINLHPQSKPVVLNCSVKFDNDGSVDDGVIAVKPKEYMQDIGCDDDTILCYLNDLSDVFKLMKPKNGEGIMIVDIYSFLL